MENHCFKSSGRIEETTQPTQWRHVRTRKNAADLSVTQLIESKLWWNNPTFLEKSPSKWPTLEQLDPNTLEHKPVKLVLNTMSPNNELLRSYSSWKRLIHISEIIFRIYRWMRYKIRPLTNYLTVAEFKEVEKR